MTQQIPHIYFNSSMDSADEWRAALATQFEEFRFSMGESIDKPSSVDVAMLWTVPEGGLERFTHLRAILSLGAGVNQLDLQRLPAHVPLARLVDDDLTRMMIDYAKTAVYRYHRKFHIFERNMRHHEWNYCVPNRTSSTSVGILGLGELGAGIARTLRAEGFNVLGWSRRVKELGDVITYTGMNGLAHLVGASDIVINILPLTEETRYILSRELFAKFRPGSCLVNMGRGVHVVDEDLLQALSAGTLASATLDVSTIEPLPKGHPFWDHPDILITPHVAGASVPHNAVINVAVNIRRALMGKMLLNQVDKVRGY